MQQTTTGVPAPRLPLSFEVRFRKSYAREESGGMLRNLSLTGAFLNHKENLRRNEKVTLEVNVSGRLRQLQAEVIWSNDFGSGVKFLPINNRDIQMVDDLLYFVENKIEGTKTILTTIFEKIS